MKKLYAFVATTFVSLSVFAQTVIYSENMGTATTTTNISANTFQNGSPITYTGTADVRATLTSLGYTNASGGANVMVNASGEYFQISGIDTSQYNDIQLSFGQRKGTATGNNELKVEVSPDGSNWTTLSYTRPSGTGTAIWIEVTPTGAIPSTKNLFVKFTGTNTIEWRIDDVKLTGTSSTLAASNFSIRKNTLVKNTLVDTNILFGAKSDVKIYSANGQLVKTASVDNGTSLELTGLPKGIYIVTGEVEGQRVSHKIIKK